jgi:hypothetical protein
MPCSPGLTRRTWQMTHWIQREIPKREMEVRVPTRGLTHESFPRSHADRPFHPFQRSPDNVRSTRSRGPVETKPSRDFSSLTGSSTAGSSSLPSAVTLVITQSDRGGPVAANGMDPGAFLPRDAIIGRESFISVRAYVPPLRI